MEIVGIGTQILECPRVRKLIDRHGERFLYQVFTEREIGFCNARTHATEFYAAFWAAKEAVFRSLGTKWRRGMDWRDIEIVCEAASEPRVVLSGPTRDLAASRGASVFKLTFAYSRMFATATVLALRS